MVLMGTIGAIDMKFKVGYSLISWSYSGKVTRKSVNVEAEDLKSAVLIVIKKTQGRAFNFIVENLEV